MYIYVKLYSYVYIYIPTRFPIWILKWLFEHPPTFARPWPPQSSARPPATSTFAAPLAASGGGRRREGSSPAIPKPMAQVKLRCLLVKNT